jgi:hypothetical protein
MPVELSTNVSINIPMMPLFISIPLCFKHWVFKKDFGKSKINEKSILTTGPSPAEFT